MKPSRETSKPAALELRKERSESLRSEALNRYIDEAEGEIDRVHKLYTGFTWRVFTVMAVLLSISVGVNLYLGHKVYENNKPTWSNKK
jgi:hypothetical protein